jgi:uncharacterized protein YndB with AHSA1/START domain
MMELIETVSNPLRLNKTAGAFDDSIANLFAMAAWIRHRLLAPQNMILIIFCAHGSIRSMKCPNGLELRSYPLTRRQLIVSAVVTGGLAASINYAGASTDDGVSHTAESIHQEPVFKANRKRVYEALTDAGQFSKVVQLGAATRSSMSLGNKAIEINPGAGGAFTLFGGHIVGRQIELVPNQRIVQAWRVADWNPGVYSIAKFEFTEQGSGTKIVFDHAGFPAGKAEHLAAGWAMNYWEPLHKYLSA